MNGSEEAEPFKIVYITDTEGNYGYFEKVVKSSELVFFNDSGELDLRPNAKLVFGGDVCDKGTGSIRIAKQLVALKKKYPTRVTLILGNRDINKMRWVSELDDKEMERWQEVPGPYWVKESIRVSPKQFLEKLRSEMGENAPPLEKLNTRANRIRWMLECTMGAQGDFERRRQELTITLNKPNVSDEEVVESYRASVAHGGEMREFLLHGQLAYIHSETMFMHGGVTLENYGYVPFSKTRIDDVHEWVKALNSWLVSEVRKWVYYPYWRDNRRGETPPPKDKYDTHDWSARGGDRLLDYVVPGTVGTIVITHMFDSSTNFAPVPEEIVEKLNRGGVRRLVVGHQPHGFAPSIIKSEKLEVIDGDTSYSDMKSKDNRGDAWAEIVIDGSETHVHGEIVGGKKIQFSLSLQERGGDPFIGRMVKFPDATGWWVKGRFQEVPQDGKLYILSKVKGYVVEYAYYSYKQLAELNHEIKHSRLDLSHSVDQKSYQVPINGANAVVTKADGVDVSLSECVNMPAFVQWVLNLDPKMVVRAIEILSAYKVGPSIRFLKFRTDISCEAFNLPGIVFLRGNSVSVLVIFSDPADPQKQYVLVEKHPRAAIGRVDYFEIPAGMDEGGSFMGVVRNLLEDEAGIDITAEKLINLNEEVYNQDIPIYMSAGASDEGMRFFLVEVKHSSLQLEELKKQIAFVHPTQSAKTYVKPDIVLLDDLMRMSTDAKTIVAVQLYNHYLSQSKNK